MPFTKSVLSIDEMWSCFNWREPAFVEGIGRKIKATVQHDVSPVIKVSVGAGPNKYLAKRGSKMRKPDGLFILERKSLPGVLDELKLRDLTRVGSKMKMRLHTSGIHTVAQLCRAKKHVLRGVWSGVLGDRLWHLLGGDEIPDLVSAQKTIGHSHVLPPDHRKPDDA
jgi:DNA polymerase-4